MRIPNQDKPIFHTLLTYYQLFLIITTKLSIFLLTTEHYCIDCLTLTSCKTSIYYNLDSIYGLGYWCLTPPTTLYQFYCGGLIYVSWFSKTLLKSEICDIAFSVPLIKKWTTLETDQFTYIYLLNV